MIKLNDNYNKQAGIKMDFMIVLSQILKLFLLIIIGFAARKMKVFDDYVTKGMTSVLLKLFLPGLIISSMQRNFSVNLLMESSQILLISFAVYAFSFLLALGLPYVIKPNDTEKGVFQFIVMFSNVGFMGYPVLQAVFGKEALFYAAVYNMPFNLLAFTIGIIFLTGNNIFNSKFESKLFLNPGVISVLIGFILFVFSIKLPTAVSGSLQLLGDMTPPFSMIIIGAMLAKIEYSKIFKNKKVYVVSFIRLILIPILVWVCLKSFIHNPLMLGVPIITAAMPAAANTPILAEEYGGNGELGSQGVLISTLFSIITIPFMAALLV
jgi:hypothetical protein